MLNELLHKDVYSGFESKRFLLRGQNALNSSMNFYPKIPSLLH